MKKFLKSIFSGLGFVGIFLVAQIIVTFAMSFYYSFMIGFESGQSGYNQTLEEINTLVNEKIDEFNNVNSCNL